VNDVSFASPSQPTFVVLGAGTWGTTLADVLDRNGHPVRCWDVDAALIERLGRERRHPKLEGLRLSERVAFHADLVEALASADVAIMAVPSRAMRSACQAILDAMPDGQPPPAAWVICTKGIEQGTRLLMHEVLCDVMGEAVEGRVGVLSGPSHAEEVCLGLPTTLVAAARDQALAKAIQGWFFRPRLRVYTHDDVLGVELGGSVKNVIAIAAGVADGLGFGDNARAALMTRGLAEIVRLGLAVGARLETFMGLSGIGDLIVTAGSRHSRNHAFGRLLGEGASVEQALDRVGMVVEGYATALSTRQLAQRHGVEMPITEAVGQILYEGLAPRQAVEGLLARDPKPEHA
jgi:glycerol-3-phosphate dehydrogenase (NAD(P)+)